MKIPIKSVISKTDVNKLRKKRQVKAKKSAILQKNFRRLNESSTADKVQQDLIDAVSRVQRITKHFQATILKEFGTSDIQLVKRTNPILRLIDSFTSEFRPSSPSQFPIRSTTSQKEKLLPINKSRG
ncbi:hypothetical protein H310_08991 [Aphanomyces invadans]|uniref:Uncharacterized protein n=1 Tax=Aphanomyces invadans TaxID=157072 RepID=A0A024TWA4_9STRA|nr:hypothetical protein H310_08991 [Aphanomyces invadans]ETV98279.1 hypothetical protein H310_08991 [Aphanomyces invadans]|eukprot:XP_008873154.1 hypothetical protein H310_08991 [Aphanomyces invadans]